MKFKTKIIYVFAAAVIIISAAYSSLFIVNEDEYAIITQFGKPVKVIKEAGLNYKLPFFFQTINRLDKKTSTFLTQPIQLLLGDQNPLILTNYVSWKITEPLLFFQSINYHNTAVQKLGDMVNSQLGATLGHYTIENIINTDNEKLKLSEIEVLILNETNKKTEKNYGIGIVSVGITRINYPEIVAESVYNRMRSEREKEAKKFRAQGYEEAAKIEAETDREASKIMAEANKQSEILKGEGDRDAMRIYTNAYSKDPELFDFLKSLETYSEILKTKSTVVLSTESEFFKYFNQPLK